jgi:hypothetical protein
MSLGWVAHAALFSFGYFGQDLSHFCTGEQTVSDTHSGHIMNTSRYTSRAMLFF